MCSCKCCPLKHLSWLHLRNWTNYIAITSWCKLYILVKNLKFIVQVFFTVTVYTSIYVPKNVLLIKYGAFVFLQTKQFQIISCTLNHVLLPFLINITNIVTGRLQVSAQYRLQVSPIILCSSDPQKCNLVHPPGLCVFYVWIHIHLSCICDWNTSESKIFVKIALFNP